MPGNFWNGWRSRRRRDRRDCAGDRDPPEDDDHAQSAVDGRDIDGMLRLPAAAVCARGPHVLLQLRPPGRARHGGPGCRADAGATRGIALVCSVPRSSDEDRGRADTSICSNCGRKGFNRLFQNRRMFEFSTPESLLEIDFAQPLFMLADRLAIAAGSAAAPGGYGGDLLPRSGGGDLRERR